MAGVFLHDNEEHHSQGEFVTPSMTMIGAACTGNESWMVGGGYEGIWNNDRLHYMGGAGYGSINMDYCGGPANLTDDGFGFNGEGLLTSHELPGRIGTCDWLIGANFEFSQLDMSFDNPLEDSSLPGKEGDFSNSALGWVAEYDSRDTIFAPNKGHYLRLQVTRYDEAIGGDFDYSNYAGAYRDFWQFCYQIESIEGNRQRVFLPATQDAWRGSVCVVDCECVTHLDLTCQLKR